MIFKQYTYWQNTSQFTVWPRSTCLPKCIPVSRLPGRSHPGASFEGGWGAVAPQGKRKKERKKEKRKKEKKKERKKGTMNNVKLLHIKCCFFQFFNSPVALKNKKKIWPPQEKLKWRSCSHLRSAYQWTMLVPKTKSVTIDPRGFLLFVP